MKLKYFSWIPAVSLMVMIFLFSSKPAENSNVSSMQIVNQMIQIYENITDNQYLPEQKTEMEDFLNFIVRKSAHFCEYAVLAIAIAFHFSVIKIRNSRFYVLMTAFLYAATDEFHQTLIPGRAGLFRDVILDTAGATAGLLLFILIVKVCTIKYKKNLISKA